MYKFKANNNTSHKNIKKKPTPVQQQPYSHRYIQKPSDWKKILININNLKKSKILNFGSQELD